MDGGIAFDIVREEGCRPNTSKSQYSSTCELDNQKRVILTARSYCATSVEASALSTCVPDLTHQTVRLPTGCSLLLNTPRRMSLIMTRSNLRSTTSTVGDVKRLLCNRSFLARRHELIEGGFATSSSARLRFWSGIV